ncbi:unnamed protein product [Spodoptera littoralis]|uniref:Uncharacterized protein n=1 Tax=Spodoptera littoralis TaxID=7109 RepID=A0A9P0I7X6_SPOLI|nr:unnamed protein product [Spodoptera littoralis]CAH1641814.1 unnamed protein product [Spodoptera littoralis]
MIILKGNNLGERHKDLNAKVKEAREKLVDFDELKQKPEQSDVDKLFKIALASKYMNIDYIVEVLKCGDPLYISKALKCDWMYDDKYAHIINPEYLQNNIIPFMSTKMKKKMLTGKFQFIKEIFTSKFPEEEFEMQLRFYERNCYEIMTAEEKETWALQQIASGKEILGKDSTYFVKMIILKGNNLGERHKDLNAKVKEAREKLVDFDELKQKPEQSDVDKLFKIALASKYMNIDYIVEVLKCGDPLYISKALKCDWMYDDKYAHIINPEYLQNNINPFMSTKMKKKMLTGISIHVRNESRAAEFYNYCMDIGCTNIAIKFLYFTSDNFKLKILKDPSKFDHLRPMFTCKDGAVIKNFIGTSFPLAEAFLKLYNYGDKKQVLRKLIYLYAFSQHKYLRLLEKYTDLSDWRRERKTIDTFLSLRISKSIMKKHKDRVLKKPTLYINILSKRAIIKYSTEEDAKHFAIALLPDDVLYFWINEPFCIKQRFLLDIITTSSKYKFVKEIFTSKYPDEEFDTDLSFFSQVCNLMTAEEKEVWAIEEIARQNAEYGEIPNYQIFKLVTFEKAFEDIEKLLFTTRNSERNELLFLLIEIAKDQLHLERVLNIFYEKQKNIEKCSKEQFIDKVLQYFNVYEFGTSCWEAFNTIFCCVNVYSSTEYIEKYQYRTIATIFHIINDIELPAALKNHIDVGLHFISLHENNNKLTKEQAEKVFQYFLDLYMAEICKFENVPYNDEVKEYLRRYIHDILRLLGEYNRTKEDCPELVKHFMQLDRSEFDRLRVLHTELEAEEIQFVEPLNLMCNLKTDSKLLIEHLQLLRKNINVPYKFKITSVLKKLKIYFSQDIAKEYLTFFCSLLDEDKLRHKEAQAGVHALFLLGDDNFKVDLMKKFAPVEATINHKEIDEKLLRVQRAICSHILYSRRPVPLEYIFMYLKGDYVHFCLPMFNALLSNLPFLQLINFVETLLNKPVSIQKHGIRLAFECLNLDNLNAVILRAWNKTKNISLRIVIFDALFKKIAELPNGHEVLFHTLKSMILTLQNDDDDEIFNLIKSNLLPEHLTIECIETAWKIFSHFPLSLTNIDRMCDLINYMITNIDKMHQGIVREIIDTFIASGFKLNKETRGKFNSETSFIESKWRLTLKYIMNEDDLEKKIEITKLILIKCFKPKDGGNVEDKHVLIDTGMKFISQLEGESYNQTPSRFVNINSLMQSVIQTMEAVFTMEEIYLQIWELQLGIVARKAINKPVRANAAHVFAKELGNLVKEYAEKELFFNCFLVQIAPLVSDKITTVCNAINDYNDEKFYMKVCRQLTSYEMIETYWLVLYLLPIIKYGVSRYQTRRKDCLYIIHKLSKLNNKEIRFYMFNTMPDLGKDLISIY